MNPSILIVITIALSILCLFLGFLIYESKHASSTPLPFSIQGKSFPPYERPFLSQALSAINEKPPVVCNVQIVDIDNNGLNELLICDTQQHGIYLGEFRNNTWSEQALATEIKAPAHACICDYDKDGDNDIIVADLGDVFPNDELVGQILLLKNDDGAYTKELLYKHLGRVADVQAADFDGDGDIDLCAAVFGHDHGEVIWLEQDDKRQLIKHQLLEGPGAIHVPIADYDNDGDLDFACVLSQDEEEVWICINNGDKTFTPKNIFKSLNNDLGSAGLVACDIDGDGDQDLILPNGDNLEEFFHFPQSYHGCHLLVNTGDLQFKQHRISDLPGCYAASTGDIDHDGDLDIVLVSMVNNWDDTNAASVVVLEQQEALHFETKQIAAQPICFITCTIGDLNNDTCNDIICGAFRIQAPFDRSSRLHAWFGTEQ